MSRITSISRTSRAFDERPAVNQAHGVTDIVVLPTPEHKRRATHRAKVPQMAAFSAHILAGTPRRGLKADPAEQARIFSTYARLQYADAMQRAKTRVWA